MARGPSKRTQWDSNPQPLNTCMSRIAGSTTELSPALQLALGLHCLAFSHWLNLRLMETERNDLIALKADGTRSQYCAG